MSTSRDERCHEAAHQARQVGHVADFSGYDIADIHVLAIDTTTTPPTLFAGAAGGVVTGAFRSTDSGGSWSGVNSGLPDTDVNALVIDPTTTPSARAQQPPLIRPSAIPDKLHSPRPDVLQFSLQLPGAPSSMTAILTESVGCRRLAGFGVSVEASNPCIDFD
jgi:hypothetical protein